MVFGLFVVREARADGAWVLWEEHPLSQPKWIICGAYPSYETCIQAEEFSRGLASDNRCKLCEGGHYAFDQKTRKLIYWKCFPESVDPRK